MVIFKYFYILHYWKHSCPRPGVISLCDTDKQEVGEVWRSHTLQWK